MDPQAPTSCRRRKAGRLTGILGDEHQEPRACRSDTPPQCAMSRASRSVRIRIWRAAGGVPPSLTFSSVDPRSSLKQKRRSGISRSKATEVPQARKMIPLMGRIFHEVEALISKRGEAKIIVCPTHAKTMPESPEDRATRSDSSGSRAPLFGANCASTRKAFASEKRADTSAES